MPASRFGIGWLSWRVNDVHPQDNLFDAVG
jgi:hypothetical protein